MIHIHKTNLLCKIKSVFLKDKKRKEKRKNIFCKKRIKSVLKSKKKRKKKKKKEKEIWFVKVIYVFKVNKKDI